MHTDNELANFEMQFHASVKKNLTVFLPVCFDFRVKGIEEKIIINFSVGRLHFGAPGI
jgi:hypothetical protein